MTRQEALELLQPLVEENEYLNITLVMGRKSVSELCNHYGTWNDFDFTCDSNSYWRSAEVEAESDVEDLYNLLLEKDLGELSSEDFSSLSLGEAEDADTDVTNIQWENDTPDDDYMDDNDFSAMDLYWDSEIGDCEIEFDAGSVESIKFKIGDTEYVIE